jgi:hypothetical protein
MSAPTNALSYNQYIQQIASLAVVTAAETNGVWAFVDAPLQAIVPSMLNYAELRIGRDLETLSSQTSNIYTLTAGSQVFSIPVDDFLTIQTLEIVNLSQGSIVNATPLLPVSKEFIQNVYGGLASAGTPQYFAMYGDNFGSEQDSATNIYFAPTPNYGYSLRVTGTAMADSLYQGATAGAADTVFTYTSAYYPDMLIMASMIFISAYQRNFSATSDSADMGQTYEKQYQALRLGAIPLENRRKQQGSAWSAYGTPTAATPSR